MKKFYVKSKKYNVLGDELSVNLAELNGTFDFVQLWLDRQWTEVLFDSELEALQHLQKMYPDRSLTVFEDTGKVLSTYAHESAFTSMKICMES